MLLDKNSTVFQYSDFWNNYIYYLFAVLLTFANQDYENAIKHDNFIGIGKRIIIDSANFAVVYCIFIFSKNRSKALTFPDWGIS